LWNVAFAVGKTKRQLNDWFKNKKNKRARKLKNKFTGRSGLKLISSGFKKVLELRWLIEPGDVLIIDCTSAEPEKQYKAYQRWYRKHPDMGTDVERLEYYWTRPPHPDDVVWKNFKVIPMKPREPLASTKGSVYFDCFRIQPKDGDTLLSTQQIIDLLSPALHN
jgi:hypothetical protein